MINTNGHNVNPQFDEVYKHVMRFKLNSLLQECRFISKSAFSREEYYRANFPMQEIAKQHFVKQK